jgi:hypothetical protein
VPPLGMSRIATAQRQIRRRDAAAFQFMAGSVLCCGGKFRPVGISTFSAQMRQAKICTEKRQILRELSEKTYVYTVPRSVRTRLTQTSKTVPNWRMAKPGKGWMATNFQSSVVGAPHLAGRRRNICLFAVP